MSGNNTNSDATRAGSAQGQTGKVFLLGFQKKNQFSFSCFRPPRKKVSKIKF